MEKKNAFTLAEVLITLGIIGVVAAMTMPILIQNINERINSERQANIAQKVTQAMEQMRVHGLLNTQYASTDAFVDELQNYLKIAKRCDSAHIAECWPTAKVTTADGEEFEVSEAKTGANLNHKNNKTDNVGLILADGASLIMTYNENAGGLDVGDAVSASKKDLPVGGGKFKEFPYSTSVASAVDFVMDVNGSKGPNSETINGKYHDIRSFNGAQFAKACDFKVGNLCVKNLGNTYGYVVTCSDTTWDSHGLMAENPYCPNNGWAGAKKACADIGMTLASKSNLDTIYAQKGNIAGVPISGMFWSSEEYNGNTWSAWKKNYSDGKYEYETKLQRYGALCVGN